MAHSHVTHVFVRGLETADGSIVLAQRGHQLFDFLTVWDIAREAFVAECTDVVVYPVETSEDTCLSVMPVAVDFALWDATGRGRRVWPTRWKRPREPRPPSDANEAAAKKARRIKGGGIKYLLPSQTALSAVPVAEPPAPRPRDCKCENSGRRPSSRKEEPPRERF